MKITSNKKLSNLAGELSDTIGVEDLLKDHGIDCISQCLTELYDGDARNMFEFGHKYWGKSVISFYDDQFSYFAVGNAKEIEKILKQELKEIEKEDND